MDFFQEARKMGILAVMGEPLENKKLEKEKNNSYKNKVVIKYLSYVLPGVNIMGMLIILFGSTFNISNEYYTTFSISSVIFGLTLGIISILHVFISKNTKYEKEVSIIGLSSFLPLLAIMIIAFFQYLM